jgi:hypothetical protein
VLEGVRWEETAKAPRLVVSVRPVRDKRKRCSTYGRRCRGYDGGEALRTWRALEFAISEVHIEAKSTRVLCGEHVVVVARVPWASARAGITRAFEDLVARLAVNPGRSALTELVPERTSRVKLVSADAASRIASVGTERCPQPVDFLFRISYFFFMRARNIPALFVLFTLGCPRAQTERRSQNREQSPIVDSGTGAAIGDHSAIALPPVMESPAVKDAERLLRVEYELLDHRSCGGAKLYARGSFLPFGDEDFFGRLRVVFGPPQRHGDDRGYFCLRQRSSGVRVYAYSAQSGPSYGGEPDSQESMDRRFAADPVLRDGHPVDWSLHEHDDPTERHRLSVLEHAWGRRAMDALAPADARQAITRLDQLLNSISPANH